MKKFIKHLSLIAPLLLLAVMILGGNQVFAGEFLESSGTADSGGVEVLSEQGYDIADGVREGVITVKNSFGESTVHVVQVQANAKAKFKALTPGYYTAGSTAESRKTAAESWGDSSWSWLGVSDMVAQYQSASDSATVLAAINGDFYGRFGKAPDGSIVLEGNELMHSEASEYEYFFATKQNGRIAMFQRTAGQHRYVQEGICAPFWILRNDELNQEGIIDKDWTESPEKRSALAIKPDGTSIMVTVEAPGVTLKQLAELLKVSGYNNVENLDGGRSITFLTKRSGESNVSRKSEMYYSVDGTYMERPTATALMLVADEGPANIVPGEVTETTITTSSDTYTAGDAIDVTASSNVEGAWVSLLKASDNAGTKSYFWYYVNGADGGSSWVNGDTYDICTDGVCSYRDGVNASTQLAEGDYKVVVISDRSGSNEILAEAPIKIKAAPAPQVDYKLQIDKEQYQVGEQIKFKATAPIAETWVGLYHKDDVIPDDMSFFWYDLMASDQDQWNVINRNGGKVTEQDRHTSVIQHTIGDPLPVDDYKLVLFEAYSGDGTYRVKASVDFKIVDGYHITYMDGDTVLSGIEPSGYRDADVANNGIALGKAEKPGYTFVNWFANKDLTGKPIRSLAQGSSGDKTFYAKFEKNTYTLTFDTDGGDEVDSISALYQDPISQPADPAKDGAVFCGWVTEKGGSVLFDFEKGLSDNTTIYASWRDEGTLAVSFDSNGGSGIATQGVISGEKAIKPDDPTKEGFVFDGWFADKDLKQRFDFGATAITADITLYAKWIVKLEDMLILSEESRGDKTYNSGASDYVGEKLFEYFYGDTVTVEATAEEPGAWVGVFQDDDFISKKFDKVVDNNWYYVDDYINKDDRRVDLRTVNGSSLPFGINYWAVLLSKDNKVLKAVPFNYRTFNVDRPEVVEKKIKAELEWTSKVANGEDQKPALTIRQVNEHFNGTFEETLVEGKDYTVQYPASSSDPGSYSIKVKYASPSSDNSDGHIHYMGNTEYEYEYYLTASEGDYVVTYELGGGTNHGDNPEIFHTGTEIVLKSPSKIGYSFDGWTSNGEPITAIPADAERNYKVKANWVADEDAPYAIKYVLNGGSNVVENPDHYTGNVDIDIIPASKGGYTFDGWFFDDAFTKPADVIPKGNEGDVTLYAKFTKNGSSARFSITTDVTGGDISSNKTVASGGSYTVKYTPNEGYVLSEILVDGEPVDIAAFPAEYTFENVTKSHSIAVTFKKTSGGDTPEESEVEIGTIVPYNGNTYVVTSVKNKTVALSVAKNAKSVTVPATVTVDGAKFKVTGIKSKAFKSSKATTVYIKTKSLSKARVKTSLKSSKVKTVRVKVSTKKATNKKYVKKYKKYFTKANAGRKVTIK